MAPQRVRQVIQPHLRRPGDVRMGRGTVAPITGSVTKVVRELCYGVGVAYFVIEFTSLARNRRDVRSNSSLDQFPVQIPNLFAVLRHVLEYGREAEPESAVELAFYHSGGDYPPAEVDCPCWHDKLIVERGLALHDLPGRRADPDVSSDQSVASDETAVCESCDPIAGRLPDCGRHCLFRSAWRERGEIPWRFA